MAINVYNMVTDRIIAQLENGIVPWRKTWNGSTPINYVTRRTYHGINLLLLPFGGEYMTFRQCAQAGGRVKKGEKSNLIVFYKMLERLDEDGNIETIPFLRYSNVFHISQCEGIESKLGETIIDETITPIECAQSIIDKYVTLSKVTLNPILGSNRALYDPNNDIIGLPVIGQFENAVEYYSTAYHEIAHSTGHNSRLNRLANIVNFADHSYSKEELIAEIASTMLVNFSGIERDDTFENSVNYIGNWLKVLRGDSKMIVTAASAAQRAVNLILNENQKDDDAE